MEYLYTLILLTVVALAVVAVRVWKVRQDRTMLSVASSPRREARMAQGTSFYRSSKPKAAEVKEPELADPPVKAPLKVIVGKSVGKSFDPTPIFSQLASQFESRGIVLA